MGHVMGIVFIAIGIWSICGAGFALGLFMEHPKARSVIAILGRTGARIFFVMLGCLMISLGVWFWLSS
jgi:hypothetical protein